MHFDNYLYAQHFYFHVSVMSMATQRQQFPFFLCNYLSVLYIYQTIKSLWNQRFRNKPKNTVSSSRFKGSLEIFLFSSVRFSLVENVLKSHRMQHLN